MSSNPTRIAIFTAWSGDQSVADEANAFVSALTPDQQDRTEFQLSTCTDGAGNEGCYYTILVTYPIAINESPVSGDPIQGRGIT